MISNFFREEVGSKPANENNETQVNPPSPSKVWYGLVIFVTCIMTIFFVTLLTYYSQKVNKDKGYVAFIIFVIIALIVLLYYQRRLSNFEPSFLENNDNSLVIKVLNFFRRYGAITPSFSENNNDDFMSISINFLLSVGYLFIVGVIVGIGFGSAVEENTDQSSIFSKNANYNTINKYITSSVALWFAMLLSVLFTLHFKNDKPGWGAVIIAGLIFIILFSVYIFTLTDLNIYTVGKTVEVNDAGKNGHRWIRAKVRSNEPYVRDSSDRVTAVYVENPEYGYKGDNEEGNKNSRYSYGLSSVRLPMNKYKLGDRVQVLEVDTWKGGIVNGFTYHNNGNLNAVFVKRDDGTNDTDSYSIINPVQVRRLAHEPDNNTYFQVGKTVEVDDAGPNGHRWIRAKVREPRVRDDSNRVTAVYVENPEYGEQGHNEEGNKNSRYSYGLSSVRLPENQYKLGDRVQVLNGNSWKGGTVNGFTYHNNGNLNAVFIKRDDGTNDTDSYSLRETHHMR